MGKGCFDWEAHYNSLHQSFPGHRHKPVIAITGNFGDKGCELAEGYYQSVIQAGGVPLVIPPFDNADAIAELLNHVDAILLSGGGDMNPLFVDEEPWPELHSINPRRDMAELVLIRLAYDRQIPMMGICRGIQMLAVALGGSIHQDINAGTTLAPEQRRVKHSQDLDRCYASHSIEIKPESNILGTLFPQGTLAVNSFHHQAVNLTGEKLRVAATATDGVIEAIESTEHKPILGVQWHPECFALRGDNSMMPLFHWLVNEAQLFAEAKKLHQNMVSLDSHCDTPMFFDQHIHFDQRDPRILVDLHKMTEGHLDASIMVAYLEQGLRTDEALAQATTKADRILTEIEDMVNHNANDVELARTPDDLYRIKQEGKKAIMLGIENGYAIGKNIDLLDHFCNRGIVYMTLCHNGDNDICDSARGKNEHGGLSSFGEEVVKRMNELGLMVDLSHAAESSFYDALQVSKLPIVCSHSSSKALCNVPRNLSDDQMRSLAAKGGVAQVTLYHGFLRTDGGASIIDAMEHLNHMIDVMGIEHVGIGTDFDGDGGVPGCASASEAINFTRHLLLKRYSADDIKLIWGENFMRVMRQVQQERTL